MKDWKFLQVGNTKTNNETIDPSDAELRKLEDELNGWLKMYDSKDPNVDKANIEKNIRSIRADIEKYKRKHKIVDNESIDKQEWSMFNGLRKKAESEIGNATGDEYNAEIQRLTKKAEQLRRMGQGRQAMEIEKQIEKLGKELHEVGNEETKAERKFGKVMGEFEEGALKTPQGKTVTDPAQAKAIAYSEADKVDNLKRARNAMNKKCGNATKTYSGKYLDIYDNGHVVVKEGWAFGEKFNEDNFGRWIEEQIRAKEKVLQECKQMKREFEST